MSPPSKSGNEWLNRGSLYTFITPEKVITGRIFIDEETRIEKLEYFKEVHYENYKTELIPKLKNINSEFGNDIALQVFQSTIPFIDLLIQHECVQRGSNGVKDEVFLEDVVEWNHKDIIEFENPKLSTIRFKLNQLEFTRDEKMTSIPKDDILLAYPLIEHDYIGSPGASISHGQDQYKQANYSAIKGGRDLFKLNRGFVSTDTRQINKNGDFVPVTKGKLVPYVVTPEIVFNVPTSKVYVVQRNDLVAEDLYERIYTGKDVQSIQR